MRDFLYSEMVKALGVERIHLNGHPSERLPNTLSLGIRGVESHQLLTRIDSEVAISAGSACHADSVSISGVLKAMQVPDEWAQGTLRFSVGRETTSEEIQAAVAIITSVITG